MYLKDKLYTLKMKEGDSVIKHIHTFRAHLESLLAARSTVQDDEVVLILMRSLPSSYRFFITSLRRQPGITMQSLITNLIQEETLMKNISVTIDSTSTLYVGKKFQKFGKKLYHNKQFKKGKSTNSKFYEKKNVMNDKKCFFLRS